MVSAKTLGDYCFNKELNIGGWVDRFHEHEEDDPQIFVELDSGEKASFWLMGLTNEEYIKRTFLINSKTP